MYTGCYQGHDTCPLQLMVQISERKKNGEKSGILLTDSSHGDWRCVIAKPSGKTIEGAGDSPAEAVFNAVDNITE